MLADLRDSEKIECTAFPHCPFSYTLAYGQTENRMVGSENNIDIMRSKAKELLKANHPHTRMADYVWAGPAKGWLDRELATAGGIIKVWLTQFIAHFCFWPHERLALARTPHQVTHI